MRKLLNPYYIVVKVVGGRAKEVWQGCLAKMATVRMNAYQCHHPCNHRAVMTIIANYFLP